jgi:hypothetical protein
MFFLHANCAMPSLFSQNESHRMRQGLLALDSLDLSLFLLQQIQKQNPNTSLTHFWTL